MGKIHLIFLTFCWIVNKKLLYGKNPNLIFFELTVKYCFCIFYKFLFYFIFLLICIVALYLA